MKKVFLCLQSPNSIKESREAASKQMSANTVETWREKLVICLGRVTEIITRSDFDAVRYMQGHTLTGEVPGIQRTARFETFSALVEETLGAASRALGQVIVDKLGDTAFTANQAAGWVVDDVLTLSRMLAEDPSLFLRHDG